MIKKQHPKTLFVFWTRVLKLKRKAENIYYLCGWRLHSFALWPWEVQHLGFWCQMNYFGPFWTRLREIILLLNPPVMPLPCVPVNKPFNLMLKPLKCCPPPFIWSVAGPEHRPPLTPGAVSVDLTTVTSAAMQPKHFADVWHHNPLWRLFLTRVFVEARPRNITCLTWWLADFCCLLAVFPIWANCLGTWSVETDEEIGLRRSISRLSLKSAAPRGSRILSSWPNRWWNAAHLHIHNLL